MSDAAASIPFNQPYSTGAEFGYIQEAVENQQLSGNGRFTRRCTDRLAEQTGCERALLTHSGTGALEMAALLAGLEPGDEVIMPSFTFVSTANAFVLRGAVPVFVDIRPDTLNLDEAKIEAAITPRTRAIVPVHYAGIACAMDAIMEVARRHELLVIEDAAHALPSSYRGRQLGAIGHMGALSFHDTKNVTCGEGGALLVNDAANIERAEIVLEKGTNRSQFMRGTVDRYRWVDVGSSYLPSEITAAFLWAQLQSMATITAARLACWERYHEAFADLETTGAIRRPVVPDDCTHNGHMYYLLVPGEGRRDRLIAQLAERQVGAVFHYVPLHSSPAGQRFARASGDLSVTDRASSELVRLPMWMGLSEDGVDRVVDAVRDALTS